MRILFLDQFSELGGAQRCLLELLPAAQKAGWEAHAAAPGDGPLLRLLEERVASVYRLSLGDYSLGRKGLGDAIRFFDDLRVVGTQISALVSRLRPDVLYVNGPRLMPAVAQAAGGRAVIFHCHNTLTAWNGRWLVTRALESANASVIAASQHLARQWKRPARVIYGGVQGPPPGYSRSARNGGPRVGLIGRFGRQKGQREFAMAAADLQSDWPDAEFILCGDALFGDPSAERYRDRLLAAAPACVRYLGWRQNIYEVLETLDLLVLPSREEGGIPTVMLEALAGGIPVLATPVGGVPEIISDGRNGFLLPSPSASAIARRVRELLPQTQLLAGVGECGHRLWRERFTSERYRNEVWEAVVMLAGKPSGG